MNGSSFLEHFTVHDHSIWLKACSQIWLPTLYPKSDLCISKMKLRVLVPNYSIRVSVSDEDRSAFLAAAK
jgi:hypothetical protein